MPLPVHRRDVPAPTRRALLTAVGAVATGALAGCSALRSDDPPAGSLQFVNAHTVPHRIGFRVTDVGTRPGDGPNSVAGDPTVPPVQRSLTATDIVRPDETRTYPGAFTWPAWYAVAFTMDGRRPENGGAMVYHPAPPDSDRARFLGSRVSEGGELTVFVGGTDDPGPFTPGGTG